jgi:hypothetical protein
LRAEELNCALVEPRDQDVVLGSVTAVAGSGDKQAKAKLCRLEIDEVAVAFGPPAGG